MTCLVLVILGAHSYVKFFMPPHDKINKIAVRPV